MRRNPPGPLTIRFSDPLNSFSGVSWDFGDGTKGSGNTVTHVYQQAGRYTPRISRPYNNGLCTVELTLPVIEVTPAYQIPNIITRTETPETTTSWLPMAARPAYRYFPAGVTRCSKRPSIIMTGMAGSFPTALTTTTCSRPMALP
ncbi:PKD domain-containing protein [Hymenobacter cellulosilyticus]|uniref:PKD domain-containing protein n=1 Tax=Hymenobacter cellulosilyticus TaxID=2932248 RepID=A0A8T9Q4W8_9BACT|nr:PKD domain-containing protein [Hymenobacter cellulosilyticus]UOQ72624.1 PKD domain-containing protein [Hymenobacter cellulosilyticus]